MGSLDENLEQVRSEKLSRVIRALVSCQNFGEIDDLISRKRLNWYRENGNSINLNGSDVRKAFDLFFFHYAGVNPDDITIVYEDETKIVWRAKNWCPYLEACNRLDIDTRVFCREGHEKCMDDLVKEINPRLRFSRSYERIRPYYDFCEETIELSG